MPIPIIHTSETCPLPGYEALTFRVLQNPSGVVWTDFLEGDLASDDGQAKLGRALCAFYGTSAVEGFDFSTPGAALATIARTDLPDELIYWLLNVPYAVVTLRREAIKNALGLRSANGS